MTTKKPVSFLFVLGVSIFLFIFFVIIYRSIYKEISIRFWDEQAWIGRSYFFDLLIQDDANNPLWKTYFGYNQPKLGEYLYGAILYPDYLAYKQIKNVNYIQFLIDHNFYEITEPEYVQYKNTVPFIDWGKDPYRVFDVYEPQLIEMFGEQIRPTVQLIYKARGANIFVLAAAVVIAFLLTRLISSNLIAVFTSLGLGVNFLFITAGLRVHAEGLFILFFLLTLYFFFLGPKIEKKRKLLWVLLGISTALSTQTKLNGIMLLFFSNLFLGISFLKAVLKKRWHQAFIRIDQGFVLNVAFVFAFIVMHPFLYRDPLQRILNIYQYKNQQAQEQTQIFDDVYLPTFQSRLGAMYGNFIFNPKEHCHYNGMYFLNKKACSSNPYFYAKMLLFIGGVSIFVKNAFESHNSKKIWFLASFVFVNIITGFYLILDWDRYFVHLIYYFVFFQMYGFVSLLQLLMKKYADTQLYKAAFNS